MKTYEKEGETLYVLGFPGAPWGSQERPEAHSGSLGTPGACGESVGGLNVEIR